jgi:uncharacterized membrane protein
MQTSTSPGGIEFKYRIPWHVWIIHFPISFFTATFVFQILHLFPHPMSGTFEVASNVMLIIGTVALAIIYLTKG